MKNRVEFTERHELEHEVGKSVKARRKIIYFSASPNPAAFIACHHRKTAVCSPASIRAEFDALRPTRP